MEFKNGMTYENNYARAAAYFLSTCATKPTEKNRMKAYEFITGIYELIIKDASGIGYKPVPDVSFMPWEQQKGREKDIKYIRGAIAKIETLISELFNITEAVQIVADGVLLPIDMKLGRALKKVLCSMGIPVLKEGEQIKLVMEQDCLDGLKELAEISRANTKPTTDGSKEDKAYLYFSRCVFEPSSNWTALAFDKLNDADGNLVWLCDELEKRGYQRIDCQDGEVISLDYVKQYGKKEEQLKKAWAERTHIGISVSYEELRLEPCFLWIRAGMFKQILEHVEEMPENVAEFIRQCTKTCDGCRYCVQTDKTKTRPLASIKVKEERKCPYFPGFTMNWRELSKELAEVILDTLDVFEKILKS